MVQVIRPKSKQGHHGYTKPSGGTQQGILLTHASRRMPHQLCITLGSEAQLQRFHLKLAILLLTGSVYMSLAK